ncbi:MAG: tRNA threonylcarbamoyladenosine dehydratase [Clostridia bacterium]|nr:tRNA threonylcarbamoyladenosine dehydratase [Clostridia bacterium]
MQNSNENNGQFSRIKMLVGDNSLKKLQNSHVAVFGVGGVGSAVVEALARGGVGKISIIDGDKVSVTNINRQLIATHKTVDMPKVEAAKLRLIEINPDIEVVLYNFFYVEETEFNFSCIDYVVDAIDMVSSKLLIAGKCREYGIPLISCMGTANKFCPEMFVVTDIKNTSYCPLARVMRRELKKRGIDSLKVVYSTEQASKPIETDDTKPVEFYKKQTPGSMSFVPPVAGFICAGEVIKDILKNSY